MLNNTSPTFLEMAFHGQYFTDDGVIACSTQTEKLPLKVTQVDNKVIDTFPKYYEIIDRKLYINGIHQTRFLNVKNMFLIENDTVLIYAHFVTPGDTTWSEFFKFNERETDDRYYFAKWMVEGTPIKIGERVVGTAWGDVEKGDYTVEIKDIDFLGRLESVIDNGRIRTIRKVATLKQRRQPMNSLMLDEANRVLWEHKDTLVELAFK